MEDCTLSLDVDHVALGVNPKVISAKEHTYDKFIEPSIRQKFAKIRDNYNELRLQLDGGYSVVFRAYNEGVAYRFETALPQQQVKIYGEEVKYNFAGNAIAYYPQEDSFMSHNERKYLPRRLNEIASEFIASMPVVLDATGGAKVALAESDVEEYPGLWFRGTGGPGLVGTFPHYPLKEKLEGDRNYFVTEAADYIAVTSGTRTYPWRIIGMVDRDADLLTNQMVYLLAKPSQLQDTSWIKPGKVAWDWWNAQQHLRRRFQIWREHADLQVLHRFRSQSTGSSTSFSTKAGTNLATCSMSFPKSIWKSLLRTRNKKTLASFLWVVWKTLDDQFDPAFDLVGRSGELRESR